MKLFTKEFWTEHPNKRGYYYFDEQDLGYKFLHYAKKTLKGIGITILGIVGFFIVAMFLTLLVYAAVTPFLYAECREFAAVNDLVYRFQFWNGCFVHYQGFWVDPDNLLSIVGK